MVSYDTRYEKNADSQDSARGMDAEEEEEEEGKRDGKGGSFALVLLLVHVCASAHLRTERPNSKHGHISSSTCCPFIRQIPSSGYQFGCPFTVWSNISLWPSLRGYIYRRSQGLRGVPQHDSALPPSPPSNLPAFRAWEHHSFLTWPCSSPGTSRPQRMPGKIAA